MHQEAELGVAAHWKYKEGKVLESSAYENKINWLRKILKWQDDLSESGTLVDEVSPAVLSSRMSVKVQQRFTPTLTAVENHSLKYPTTIATADDVNRIIESSAFTFNNNSCILRNRLGSTTIEVFSNTTQSVIVDNVGSFSGDTVTLTGLQVDSINSGDTFIKLSVVPANESFVTPLRETVVEFDSTRSTTQAVEVDTSVIN